MRFLNDRVSKLVDHRNGLIWGLFELEARRAWVHVLDRHKLLFASPQLLNRPVGAGVLVCGLSSASDQWVN